jgi:hypothetical protein
MSKRGQAILPFFAVQLVSVLVFLIVLLTLLTMTQNVKFTISEFDERTAFLLTGRRLVSSADCFAYEERNLIARSEVLYFGSRVFPNLLDIGKVLDYENFNCIRKDLYDKKSDVFSGFWDAANATGGALKYSIRIYDLESGKNIYDPDPQALCGGENCYFATSLIGRVTKSEIFTKAPGLFQQSSCQERYGFDRIGECKAEDPDECKKGRCKGGPQNEIRPFWNLTVPEGKCEYSFTGTKVSNFADTSRSTWEQTDWDQFDTVCSEEQSRSSVVPTMIKVGNEIHPAILFIKSCLVFGSEYEGRTLLEIEYKPPVGQPGTCP